MKCDEVSDLEWLRVHELLTTLRFQCRTSCSHGSLLTPDIALIDFFLDFVHRRLIRDQSEWRNAEAFELHCVLEIMTP
jgi:hypothetical protein